MLLSACSSGEAPSVATDSYCKIYEVIEYEPDILTTDNPDHRYEICELFKRIDRENCAYIATCDYDRYTRPDKNGRTIQDYCKEKKTCTR